MAEHVCPWRHAYLFDNFLRLLVHSPKKLFGPHVRPGMTVLDIGCGMGWSAIAMAKMVGPDGRVIAADLQPEMLAVLMRRAAKAGVAERVRPVQCGPASLGVADQVDFANAFYVVHEVPDAGALFREVRGLLKGSGSFLVVEPKGHVDAPAMAATIGLAEAAGFRVRSRPQALFSHSALLE